MVGEIFQPGLNAPIIFAGDEHKTIGAADLAGELFENGGRRAFRIFLVHPVQHRQTHCLGVDQFDIVTTAAQSLDDEICKTDSHAVGPIGAVEHEKAIGHG